MHSVHDAAGAKRFNSKVAATLEGYSDEDIFARLQRLRDGAIVEAGGSPKLSEFEASVLALTHFSFSLFGKLCPSCFHFLQYFSFLRRPNKFRKAAAFFRKFSVLC